MANKKPLFPGASTARGAVLAVLLSDQDQTGAEPLQGRVTLAAIVKSLKRKYHWPIETTSFPSNGADGRAAWATVYTLPARIVATALKGDGEQWLAERARSRRTRADALHAAGKPHFDENSGEMTGEDER